MESMEERVQGLFDTLEELRQNARVDAAFGDPVVAEGRTLIPVAQVAYGFGLGFGSGSRGEEAEQGKGEGGGGGVQTRPLGVIEVTPEGVHVEPVVDEQKIALAGVLLVAWVVAWVAGALVLIFRPRGG